MTSANNYYYDQLNKEQKRAYYAMKEGLEAIAPSFPVPRLTGREIADIYFLLRLDHPELFYSVKFNYRYYPDSEVVEFIPEYLFTKAKIKEHQQALSSRIKKLVRQAQEKKTDLEKEIFIHDFLVENVHYDKLKKPYSHEIIGSLGNGTAVCEGIAKGVKVLCDALGIWCIIALSDNNPDKGIKYRHTWNVIRLNGQYYHLDVTFDNSLHRSGTMRYDYLNLCDKQIYRDHEPSIYRLPACNDAAFSYYREKKLSFTKMEDVSKRAAQAAKKKKALIFHWRGGYLTRAVLLEMLQIFRKAGEEKSLQAAVSVNWAQAIIMVKYEPAEQKPSEQLIAEKPSSEPKPSERLIAEKPSSEPKPSEQLVTEMPSSEPKPSEQVITEKTSVDSNSEGQNPSEQASPEKKAAVKVSVEKQTPGNDPDTPPSDIDGIILENANEEEEE